MLKYNTFILLCLSICSSWALEQSIDIPRHDWKIHSVNSIQPGSPAELAFDGDSSTHWHTKWGETDKLPHNIQIDLGKEYTVNGFRYLPRPDGGNGNIKAYEFYVSQDGRTWGTPAVSGNFEKRTSENIVTFPQKSNVRYVKLVALKGFNDNPCYAAIAELDVFQFSIDKPEPGFSLPSSCVKTGGKLRFQDKSSVSPIAWEWSFPGGTPSSSREACPEITYEKPGSYPVTLKVSNRNGSASITRNKCVTVSNNIPNLALQLDGKDNDVRISMGILTPPWTLEAWIKGNDNQWNTDEVIIGGGEYGNLKDSDNRPLALKKGKLTSTKAGISHDRPLDDNWHHASVTCDGKTTRLFLDGHEVAAKETASNIIPGCIGVDRENSTFGGTIDEVRIWTDALPESTLQAWMGRSIEATHPNFKSLKGYYPFDDLKDEMSINWVARGHQSYHMRNGRLNFRGKAPLAYAVANTSPAFKNAEGKQRLFNAVVIPSEWDSSPGDRNSHILKLRIAVQGSDHPIHLSALTLDLSGTSDLRDIAKVHVYHAGYTAMPGQVTELFGEGMTPQKILTFQASDTHKAPILSPGINYFLVTFDINDKASPGNTLKSTISSFSLDGHLHQPETDTSCLDKQVSLNSNNNPNIVRQLQWNIWHGGVHLGNCGVDRIIELIKKSKADIVTMQEAYGFQERIAKAIGFQMKTAASDDNLALFSRYPLTPLPTQKTFYSNPALITLDNGRRILVDNIWIYYSAHPEYTCVYMDDGLDPNDWIKEDAGYTLQQIQHNLENDVHPHLKPADMPAIVSGDYNSCSHLDWTKAAAPFHNGYGAVDFPVSKYMIEQGYSDSFRELHPNEVERPEGTYAVVLGHLQHSRIDFSYYKGKGIKPVSCKIIRTHPEIDYVWPSDHAGVLTTYEIDPKP